MPTLSSPPSLFDLPAEVRLLVYSSLADGFPKFTLFIHTKLRYYGDSARSRDRWDVSSIRRVDEEIRTLKAGFALVRTRASIYDEAYKLFCEKAALRVVYSCETPEIPRAIDALDKTLKSVLATEILPPVMDIDVNFYFASDFESRFSPRVMQEMVSSLFYPLRHLLLLQPRMRVRKLSILAEADDTSWTSFVNFCKATGFCVPKDVVVRSYLGGSPAELAVISGKLKRALRFGLMDTSSGIQTDSESSEGSDSEDDNGNPSLSEDSDASFTLEDVDIDSESQEDEGDDSTTGIATISTESERNVGAVEDTERGMII